jgi:DNA phosphorothioation-dependent restriction protein DptH
VDRLVQEIAKRIRDRVTAAVSKLSRVDGEIRTVFHGPPMEILRPVYELLVADGGIEATLASGDHVLVPVVLQVDRLESGTAKPRVGESGICDATHLIDLRNAPGACPRFVALVEPGHLGSLSFSSASDDFGLLTHSNSGTATTTEWWHDPFVQVLVDGALDRHKWTTPKERSDALTLIEKAVSAADTIDKNVASRHSAWRVLSRIWSISDPNPPFGVQLSLACGFPPTTDGLVDAGVQGKIMEAISERFVDLGFKSTVEELKSHASESEKSALDDLLDYLQDRCGVAPRFGHAPPFYYEPSGAAMLTKAPTWWATLTTDVWRRLLEEGDESAPEDAGLHLVCLNSLVPKVKGIGPVVASDVELAVVNENGLLAPDQIDISREMPGGNRRDWSIRAGEEHALTDGDVPTHKTPIKYSAHGAGLKKTTAKIVSLKSWEPGIVVFSRTATKVSLPKRVRRKTENVAFELTLALSGQGRHYFDVYARPGVVLKEAAVGSGDDGLIDAGKMAPIRRVGDSDTYGFEVDASGDCFYQFEVVRDPSEEAEIFRVYLTCDESTPELCGSEFERLIRLNRPRGNARGSTDVNVNRQLRSADLQGWILWKEHEEQSYRPFVLGPDYADAWRMRDWNLSAAEETIFSTGRFLNDPRPAHTEMIAPARFSELRRVLFERVRGKDDNGLMEVARLGEWLATDASFAQAVEEYVDTYFSWLCASPNVAAWCDVGIVVGLEPDGTTLNQDPDALLLSPLHPVRFAWHCLAQRALFLAQRKLPCPAASVLDPDIVPDALVLPLRTAAGGIKQQVFFSVECSSDYWSILWNGSRLDRLPQSGTHAPFDKQFGVTVGGISSGFSASQVRRALDDVSDIFAAKPLLNVSVSSAAGQNNACNEGVLSWCHDRFADNEDYPSAIARMGQRFVHVIDERPIHARPENAEISNLAEDTKNAVRWLERKQDSTVRPDLNIIAQLETSNPAAEKVTHASPLGAGGLIRHRVRQQLSAGQGAFLLESRSASTGGPTGDGLADKTANAIARLENLGDARYGYAFAPSVHAVRSSLERSDYTAVSSSVIDPACFLGGWLQDMYLWDYELPSYSQRSGDSNGYYLLTKIDDLDTETLKGIMSKLPGCDDMQEEDIRQVILEVARRGIPTVRGLSRGDSGASGDLGLFITSRVIQDEFRVGQSPGSLLPVLRQEGSKTELLVLVPIDPFRGYIDDLARAVGQKSFQRPDLLVAAVRVSASRIDCRLTPIEVKYRGKEVMHAAAAQDALGQAKAFSQLLAVLKDKARDPDLAAWKLAFQHLLSSMLAFALRVYSQQRIAQNQATEWATLHANIIDAVLTEALYLEIDQCGRLVILDGSPVSDLRDFDGDGFAETLVISRTDAGMVVHGEAAGMYAGIRARLVDWSLLPKEGAPIGVEKVVVGTAPEIEPPAFSPAETTSLEPTVATIIAAPASGERSLLSSDGVTGEGIDLTVGHTIDGFQSELRRLNLSDTNLNQLNIGVVGDLGTGKTQLLKSLVYQTVSDAKRNRGVRPRFLIFDYKKDYSSDDFVKAVGARIVKPRHLPINLFDVAGAGDTMTPWLDRFKFFADVLDKIFSNVGPVQRKNLKDAVKQSYEYCRGAGRQPTIYDVHASYRSIVGNKADAPLAIIDDLVDMEMFSPEPANAQRIEEFLDGVVVISLHALGQDDRTKNMLVAIMLNMFYEHMLRIPKRPFIGESPQLRVVDSFLLVDEADNIMRYEFDVLRKILLQGREFGVGVILASQYLRHFKAGATDYREPLLSWFIHKVPNVVPQELGALGLAGDVAHLTERIKTLGKHECLFKTFDVPGEIVKGVPFYSLIQS